MNEAKMCKRKQLSNLVSCCFEENVRDTDLISLQILAVSFINGIKYHDSPVTGNHEIAIHFGPVCRQIT